MLQDGDPACNMCGNAMPGGGAPGGASGGPMPPPPAPAMSAGYPAPPAAGGGYAPAPPPAGPAAFSGGDNAPIPVSPWAAMAPPNPRPGGGPGPSAMAQPHLAGQQMAPQPFGGGQALGPPPMIPMSPSIGLAPPASPGFGAPPGMQQAGYPAPPAFAPPPGAPQHMMGGAVPGHVPMSGVGPVAPPPIVGLVSGVGVAPPPPPPVVNAPPMMQGGFGAPQYAPPLVAPPPPVPPGPLPQSPGALSGPAPAPVPQTVGSANGILVGFLVTFQNEPNGVFWPIRSGRTQLGRSGSDKVDVGINDASASSKHANVSADPSTGQAFVQDDGSRNGTFLNEQKLNPGEQRQLHDNDRLRLGSTTLVIKLLVS